MSTWFDEAKRLANKGLTASQIELGHSYLTGIDPEGNEFECNYKLAFYWLEKAHEQGAFTATHLLAIMHEEAKGVPKNISKAIDLHIAAADKGSFLSCLRLARVYAARASEANEVASDGMAEAWYKKVLSFAGEVDDETAFAEARRHLSRKPK